LFERLDLLAVPCLHGLALPAKLLFEIVEARL
jgi:hypothetical protein